MMVKKKMWDSLAAMKSQAAKANVSTENGPNC